MLQFLLFFIARTMPRNQKARVVRRVIVRVWREAMIEDEFGIWFSDPLLDAQFSMIDDVSIGLEPQPAIQRQDGRLTVGYTDVMTRGANHRGAYFMATLIDNQSIDWRNDW